MSSTADGLSLVVFAFNEEESVPHVLPEILAWLRARTHPWELVFVDDGSADRTLELARTVVGDDPRCKVFSLGANRGIGGALKAGVRSASMPWVTFLPCDGQIPVGELDVLLRAADARGVDVVFSVYRDRDDGMLRKVLSAGVRGLIRAVHGVTMRSDGPYLFRRALFNARELAPDTFFLNFEFPIRVLRRGVSYAVETIECVPRQRGVSKSARLKVVGRVARDLVDLRLRLARE
ncbi:MAG: glycosyltransferase family 2 protein [Polyangiales bacterium]